MLDQYSLFFLQITYLENKLMLTLRVQGKSIILGGNKIKSLLK